MFDETDEDQISKIAKIVDNTVTACLVERPIKCNKDLEFLDAEQQEIYSSTELDYFWTPPYDHKHTMNNYFQDNNNPRRDSFNPDTVTACLVERPIKCNKDLEFLDAEQQEIYSSTELDYFWTPPYDHKHTMNNYFQDNNDPRRDSFNPDLDYSRSDVISSSETQSIYRRLQLANQMHRCCFTYFKYADKNGRKSMSFNVSI